ARAPETWCSRRRRTRSPARRARGRTPADRAAPSPPARAASATAPWRSAAPPCRTACTARRSSSRAPVRQLDEHVFEVGFLDLDVDHGRAAAAQRVEHGDDRVAVFLELQLDAAAVE